MRIYSTPNEIMTCLRDVHERVKNQPFHAKLVDSQKLYANALYKQSNSFFDVIYKRFLGQTGDGKRNTRRPGYDNPGHVENFGGTILNEFNIVIFQFPVNVMCSNLMLNFEGGIYERSD